MLWTRVTRCVAVSLSEGLTGIWSEGIPHVEYHKAGHPEADGSLSDEMT